MNDEAQYPTSLTDYEGFISKVRDHSADIDERLESLRSAWSGLKDWQYAISTGEVKSDDGFAAVRDYVWMELSHLFYELVVDPQLDVQSPTWQDSTIPFSEKIMNRLMTLIDVDACQIDFILDFMLSEHYQHRFTFPIYASLREFIFLSPASVDDEAGSWSDIEDAYGRVTAVIERYRCEPDDESYASCIDARSGMVYALASMRTEDSEQYLLSMLDDDSESPEIHAAVLSAMREHADFYDFSDSIRKFLYGENVQYRNHAAGFLLDHIASNPDKVQQVANMGGDPAISIVRDMMVLIERLQSQLMINLLKRPSPYGELPEKGEDGADE